ncbi:oxygen-independent coproporphyrinogen-3 oxidase [Kineothrix alysoides]|uniref:Oxygen-independent coproporphyrinogen-3 oxidase n=1 Tax=Kineothrix alysoides TaxID=1469948 RepID=A0A4R1R406_9FIRM|nr:coproporphyrinogen dehydrogenase HemZ [Kineothrix alysoides]TCL60110.1 oxygen-independent coproporphyrinogen-3 oxidase [Kineothrix alysoides]
MFTVWINKAQFEYDIHSLVKAFYPEEEVKVLCEEEEMSDHRIAIEFGETSIEMTLKAQNETQAKESVSEISHASDADRQTVKNLLKQLIYNGLSKQLEKSLPWGTLTGIRPTKIPMTMLEEGKGEAEIMSFMQDTYFISEEKGTLSIDIAKRERELLSSLHYKDGYSLYIGIPFCPTTCLYCSFTSYPICTWKKRVDDYLEALEKEMAFTAAALSDKVLDTVYIGGGTPTTLEPEELERLLCSLERFFDLSRLQEFTVEAGRADSITREKLKVLKKHNITRISVNPQTMKEETLKLIGRHHSVDQVKEAFATAREEGFDNINMDIILGLPEETIEDVINTMEEIKKLRPDSLTVHSLAIKRASRMSGWIEEKGLSTLRNTDETMEVAAQAARAMGMEPYYLYRQKNMSGNLENVGYAGSGKYGIYNILIMEEMQTIAALGAGSISKAVLEDGRIERMDNVKDVALYIERIDEMIERKRKLFEMI